MIIAGKHPPKLCRSVGGPQCEGEIKIFIYLNKKGFK